MSSIREDTEAAQNKQLFTKRFYENSQLKGKQGGILLKQAARLKNRSSVRYLIIYQVN